MKRTSIRTLNRLSDCFARPAILALCAVALLSSGSVIAEDDDQDGIQLDLANIFDFKKRSGADARLQPHGDDLMGDVIDKNTGSVSFLHTDISIPGNSGLEVALHRKKGQGAVPYTPFQHGFGDWLIDLPIVSISYGHQHATTALPVFDNGCLNTLGPINNSIQVSNNSASTYIDPETHMSGAILHVPGKEVSGYPDSPQKISDPKNDWKYGGRTTDFANRCATVVVAPDGTKYKFGRHAFRLASSMPIPYDYLFCNSSTCYTESTVLYLNRKHAVYLITEVQDIHGNWVRYDYTNDSRAELTRIYSNDQREIKLFYASTVPSASGRNSRRVTHATAHGRTWNYEYTGTSAAQSSPAQSKANSGPEDASDKQEKEIEVAVNNGIEIIDLTSKAQTQATPPNDRDRYLDFMGSSSSESETSSDKVATTAGGTNRSTNGSEPYRFLHKVVLPDDRYWQLGDAQYGMRNIQFEPHVYYRCVPYDVDFELKHPDGAIGTFRIRETRHIKGATTVGDIGLGDSPGHYMWSMSIPHATNNDDCNGTFDFHTNPNGEFPWERPDGWPIYQALSIASKTISGADIPTATWDFDYRDYSGGPLSQTWTKVTEPDGTERKYTYQTVGQDFGLLKQVEVTPATGPGETMAYQYEPRGYSWCIADGNHDSIAGTCMLYTKRQIAEAVHVRDGVTYNRSYEYDQLASGYFIDQGRPNRIIRSSTLQSEQRVSDIDYWHNTAANIIGRTQRIEKNGKEFAFYNYNSKGQPTFVNKFGALWVSYGYHPDGNLKTLTDSLDHTATLEDYYRGQPRKVTHRDNSVSRRTIDANGWVTSETDGRGYTTNYDHNDAGWLTLIDRPNPWADTTLHYQNVGTAGFYSKEIHGTKENVTWYDLMLRPNLTRNRPLSGGGKTVYSKTQYDALGRVIFSSQPSSSSNPTKGTTTVFDGLGRVTQVSENFGSNATTLTAYLPGNRMRVTNPQGHVTTTTKSGYAAPNDGQTTLIEQPEDVLTTLNYDVYGNILAATQSGPDRSSTQTWSLDNRLRVCRHYVPETGSTLYQYDAADQIMAYGEGISGTTGCASSIPAASRVALSYDERGRNTVVDYPGGPADITKSYDDDGNLRTMVNGSGNWTYTYNYLNSTETETLSVDGRSFVLDADYNSMGDMDALTYPSGRVVDIDLNGLGQTTGVDGFVTNASYHPSGAMNTVTYGNGMTYSTSLNDRLLPRDMFVNSASGERLSDLVFSWDNNGNITRIQDLVDAQYTVDMGYDGLDRLTEADGYWGNGSISYDSLGNITTKNLGAQTLSYHYNTRNRLGYVTGSEPYSFSYDPRGNVINNGEKAFTFNLQNQLSSSEGIGFSYDGHGKRVTKTVSGEKSYSIYGLDGTLYYRQKPNGDHIDYVYINGRLVTTVESR